MTSSVENEIVPENGINHNTVNPFSGALTKAIDVGLDLFALNNGVGKRSIGSSYPTGDKPPENYYSERPNAIQKPQTKEDRDLTSVKPVTDYLPYIVVGGALLGVVAFGVLAMKKGK